MGKAIEQRGGHLGIRHCDCCVGRRRIGHLIDREPADRKRRANDRVDSLRQGQQQNFRPLGSFCADEAVSGRTGIGALATASGIEWSQARHQMNGANGHLDRLLDICYARSLPLLTAICVNQGNIVDGELGKEALAGFVAGARRLGLAVSNPLEFHHRCKDECWAWGVRSCSAF